MIDIIIPVHGGESCTRRCVDSVLSDESRSARELVVVDDCSPIPALSAWLEALAAEGRITLLRNPVNLGFAGSVNRAMALHPERDVVLLNSDTEVSGDWLDRILRCSDAHPDAGTITPFSNNATICSYPYEGWAGEVPGTLGLTALDAMFGRVLSGVVVDLPTGVGFCLFIRRACLAKVGAFDELAFGRGYGEENDFCRRAAKAGWRNLLCADVFVYHRGGVSFGDERLALMRQGGERLGGLHPEYDSVVRRFIADDPLRPLREAIDRGRATVSEAEAAAVAAERASEPPAALPPVALDGGDVRFVGMDRVVVPACNAMAQQEAVSGEVWLHVAHSWGGGSERWIHDFAGADAAAARHLLLRSRSWRNQAGVRLELIDLATPDEVLLAWTLDRPIDFCDVEHAQYRAVLAEIAVAFGVRVVVISSLIGHALDALDTGLPTVVVLHDLFPFCPALFGWFGQGCRSCDGATLARCFADNPLNVFWHHADVSRWMALREAYGARLASELVQVVAPSRSVHDRYIELFPVLRGKAWHRIAHGLATTPVSQVPRPTDRLRVVVPGRLSPHKGLDLLRTVLPDIAGFADVLLLGCGDFGAPFAHLAHVRVVEDYSQAQLAAHVGAFGPDCALLVSTLPETFSYTLSEMQALGVPVLATSLGAFTERIEEGVTGFLVAPEAAAVVQRLHALASDRQVLAEVATRLRALPVRTTAQMVADYRALLPLMQDSALGPEARMMRLLSASLVDARRRHRLFVEEMERLRAEALRNATEAQPRIDALVQELAAERARNHFVEADLAGRLALTEAERDALRASTSWRMTAPLRSLVETVKGETTAPEAAIQSKDDTRPPQVLRAWPMGDALTDRRMAKLATNGGDSMLAPQALVDLPLEPGRVCLEGVELTGYLCASALTPGAPDVFCMDTAENVTLIPVAPDSGRPACRIVVPTPAVADGLSPAVGGSGVELQVVDFPLVGEWAGKWAPYVDGSAAAHSLRDELRCARRDALGLPDGSRIVVGIGAGNTPSGLLRFADAAKVMADRHNGVFFIWVGRVDEAWAAAQGDTLSLPRALRRLFVIDDAVFEPWLLSADAYLGCRSVLTYDAGAVESVACGLPVERASEAPLAGDMRPAQDAAEDVCDRLLRLLPGKAPDESSRWALAAQVRARLASAAAWERFAAACGVSCTDVQH